VLAIARRLLPGVPITVQDVTVKLKVCRVLCAGKWSAVCSHLLCLPAVDAASVMLLLQLDSAQSANPLWKAMYC
jgi:hypothetical protein